ncbi:MAG: malonic semialdehyde reductase [Proteobacteria bacterium]|nr:malonic semialdehyde reductase [Pseudomonadota bacterium]
MSILPEEICAQIFTEARSFSYWLTKKVSDESLHQIYELMKWGPTATNSCPLRILFIKTSVEKEKLITCLSPKNIEKVKNAPVTAILAYDEQFYEQIPKLFPPNASSYKDTFLQNQELAKTVAFRNSSLQGAYFIIAARAIGLDCGPMSGFDNQKVDDTFFKDSHWKSNFLCSLGYGDREKLYPRLPRLNFSEACKIL